MGWKPKQHPLANHAMEQAASQFRESVQRLRRKILARKTLDFFAFFRLCCGPATGCVRRKHANRGSTNCVHLERRAGSPRSSPDGGRMAVGLPATQCGHENAEEAITPRSQRLEATAASSSLTPGMRSSRGSVKRRKGRWIVMPSSRTARVFWAAHAPATAPRTRRSRRSRRWSADLRCFPGSRCRHRLAIPTDCGLLAPNPSGFRGGPRHWHAA